MAKSYKSARAYAKRKRQEIVGMKHKGIVPFDRGADPADVAARLREIPPDTRSVTAYLFGDPIPNDPRRQPA